MLYTAFLTVTVIAYVHMIYMYIRVYRNKLRYRNNKNLLIDYKNNVLLNIETFLDVLALCWCLILGVYFLLDYV
jgi:hypothetical protein